MYDRQAGRRISTTFRRFRTFRRPRIATDRQFVGWTEIAYRIRKNVFKSSEFFNSRRTDESFGYRNDRGAGKGDTKVHGTITSVVENDFHGVFLCVFHVFSGKCSQGGVILVSHDERLIRKVCRELWVCGKGTVKSIEGGFDEYRKIVERELAEVSK